MVYKPCWVSICYFWKMSSWNTFLNGSKGLTWHRGFWKQKFGMNLLKEKKFDLKKRFLKCVLSKHKVLFPYPPTPEALRTILTTWACAVYTEPCSDKEPSPACKWVKTGFTFLNTWTKQRMNTPRWLYVWSTEPKIPPDLLQKDLLTLDYIESLHRYVIKTFFQEKETEDKVTETLPLKNLNPLFFSSHFCSHSQTLSLYIRKHSNVLINIHIPTAHNFRYKKYNYLLTHQKKAQHH